MRMPADLILRGGRVFLGQAFDQSTGTVRSGGGRAVQAGRTRERWAQAIAITGGRISAVGDAEAVEAQRGPHTRVEDTTGRAVVPGFVDAHVHFGNWALTRSQVDLDQAPTLEAGLQLLEAAAAGLARGEWLRGRGWDRNRWGRLPTALDLDAAVGERPAALSSHDGHALWLNTSALRQVGISASTDPPPGGVIERDQSGEPSGVLFENAQDLVRKRIPEPSQQQVTAAIRRGLPYAAAAGLTGIHNLEDARSLEAFRQLDSGGELTLRVYHGIPRGTLRDAQRLQLRTGEGSDWVRLGPVKLFSDGALGSRTAFMLEPYEGRADGYRGVATLTVEELQADMRLAADAKLDMAVHAIGDAAVRRVLDVFESTRQQHPPLRERMLRIEHAQLVHPNDVPRFATLGAVASMQPIHAIADWRTADAHWGPRAAYAYAWKSLVDSGAHVAFGTDAPVEHIEPLLNLHAAITRLDPNGEPAGGWHPEQCVSLEQAVVAYSEQAAYAERASDRRGSLQVGMDADLVVIGPDPFGLDPSVLLEARVEMTVVGGRVVHG